MLIKYLNGTEKKWANLRWADLCGANLRWANLRWADLCGADLRGADLRGADLRGANLYGADLRGADLREADLRGANLYGADLRGTCWHQISSLKFDTISFFDERDIHIGCKSKSFEEWITYSKTPECEYPVEKIDLIKSILACFGMKEFKPNA